SRDEVKGGSELYFVPVRKDGGTDYRLAWQVSVHIERPRADWATLIDAEDGRILWRHDRVRHATIAGTVTAKVHPAVSTDALVAKPLHNLTVHIAGVMDTTDANGAYSGLCTGTSSVSANLSGIYCSVSRLDCASC